MAICACIVAPAGAAPIGPLDQHGRWVTDALGRTVILHGVNMVYKRPPYYPAAAGFDARDARFLARNGFDSVRLGIIEKGLEPRPGAYDQAYLRHIAATVRTLTRRGIFVLLDFHQDMYNERFQGEGWPDWAVQDDGLPPVPKLGFPTNYYAMPALIRAFDRFWANSRGPGGVGLQERLAAAWRHVAARFSSERRLVGYDLLNEPWPGSPWPTCGNPLGCPPFDRGPLTAFYRRVTSRIREVDRHTVVWYEPQVLFDFGSATSQGGVGPHAGMSFHAYCLTPGPACGRTEQLPFENAERQSDRTEDALLLTEFGATDDLTEMEPVVDRADRNRLGWEYWHYCPCADPTTSGPGTTQALVVDPRRPPRGANVKAAKLAVLERPYPQAVAGTPLRFGYNPATRRFSLAYSTARPGGGAYRFRADTQVFLPRLHYPRGYDVRASGAEPISSAGAAHLRLRTCPRRRKVRVGVTPARSGRPASVSDCRARAGANRASRRTGSRRPDDRDRVRSGHSGAGAP